MKEKEPWRDVRALFSGSAPSGARFVCAPWAVSYTHLAKEMVFPIGAPNDGFAQYFSGRSFLAPISTSQVGIFNVTFEPGCRNNWHCLLYTSRCV